MNKTLRLTIASAVLAACSASQAMGFETAAGANFVQSFNVTPTTDNTLLLSVQGLAEQYSALSFQILSGPSVIATIQNGNLIAAFNDARKSTFMLTGGTTYRLNISGTTKAATPGTFGVVSINIINGSVSPVPEPETFAMLMAGLGLMGAIARRRSKSATV
jgi:hypothetical protein